MSSQTDWDATPEYTQDEQKRIRYDRETERMLKLMAATIVVFAVVMAVSIGLALLLL